MESDPTSSGESGSTKESESSKLKDVKPEELNNLLASCKTEKCEKGDTATENKSHRKFLSKEKFGTTVPEKKEQCDANSHVASNCISESTPKVDSGEKEMDCGESAVSSNNTGEKRKYEYFPSGPRPKHRWIAPRETLLRQYGTSMRYSPSLFRYECYSSLHMVERLELMYKMNKHKGCVNTLNFNAKGTNLVSGSDDLDIIIWDWTVSEPILCYSSGHRSNVFQAKFIPLTGDSQIVSCARDGQVRLGEINPAGKCESTRKLAQHKGAAHKLAVQLDSCNSFISCGEDAVCFEIDLRSSKPEKIAVCKEDNKKVPLYSVFINPNKCYEYVAGGRDNFVRVYDKRCIREENGTLKKFCPQNLIGPDSKANVTSVVYSYNGDEILASYNDDDIYLFDANANDTQDFLHSYKGHRNSQTVKGVNFFGAKSEYVVSGSDCGYIFIWDKQSEHIVNYMHGDEGGVVNCLESNPNMPVLATSGLDDDIKIWVPSCENPPDLSGLKTHVTNNIKEREEERFNGPDPVDEEMIWYLTQHIRRFQRRASSGGASAESSNSSSESDGNDDEQEFHQTIQCTQS